MRQDAILINRDDASRACSKAVHEFFQAMKDQEFDEMACAMKMMELTLFSAMVVSKLFSEEEQDNEVLHH
jgi:hypothetical protein